MNLTPRAILVTNVDGADHTFPPSGEVARVSSSQEKLPNVGEFTVSKTVWGEVVGLPAPASDCVYIVSGMVVRHCADRPDVIAPDTGATAVRNEKGHVVAVLGFVK